MSTRNGTSGSGRCEGEPIEERVEMACRYAGIDWASDKHDVLVSDETGAELLTATCSHDEKGLTALCRMLVRLEVALVAIERPDGLLVEILLAFLECYPSPADAHGLGVARMQAFLERER